MANGENALVMKSIKAELRRCDNCAAVETFEDGQLRIREETGLIREGLQTYYLVHMVPFFRPSGELPYIIEMSTDITAHKVLEKEKLEAERLAAVGQTVAGPGPRNQESSDGTGGRSLRFQIRSTSS